MAKVEIDEGGRFTWIGGRQAPELLFDPAAIAAVEAKGDGAYALHLAGGQTIEVKGAVAAALLKKLTAGKVESPKSKVESPRPKVARAPRAKPRPSFAASCGAYFRRLLD